ncbi:MAG: 3-hydroxylacyl-ACP dehydratase [Burkholderiaceae bacterium]|nr:3-hydroxylacyl-ACP dehydratase [Burkholderiaceae bacterium]
MCLINSVLTWDQITIQCDAVSHRSTENPLRAHGRLGSVCGIEYAAQAMAIHGALLAPTIDTSPRIGYLVSVRSTTLHVAYLENIATDLLIKADCITASANNILYEFSVSTCGQLLLAGRATVVLNATTPFTLGGSA